MDPASALVTTARVVWRGLWAWALSTAQHAPQHAHDLTGTAGSGPAVAHDAYDSSREHAALLLASACMAAVAVAVLVATHYFRAPYGRYEAGSSRLWGVRLPGRVAWVLQEAPALLAVPVCVLGVPAWASPDEARLRRLPNGLLLAAFALHYAHRTLVFPFRMRAPKPTPLSVFAMAFGFCAVNGWLQARWLTRFADYGDDGVGPRFVCGMLLFAAGMFINITSDNTLMSLRRPGETGYKIPRGGAFELVSGANFFGEIVEWAGFACAFTCPRAAAVVRRLTLCVWLLSCPWRASGIVVVACGCLRALHLLQHRSARGGSPQVVPESLRRRLPAQPQGGDPLHLVMEGWSAVCTGSHQRLARGVQPRLPLLSEAHRSRRGAQGAPLETHCSRRTAWDAPLTCVAQVDGRSTPPTRTAWARAARHDAAAMRVPHLRR